MRRLRRLPIRWRLAGGSALLTLVILLGFAVAVGILTTSRLQEDFNVKVAQGANELADTQLANSGIRYNPKTAKYDGVKLVTPSLNAFAAPDNAAVRLVDPDGSTVVYRTPGAPRWDGLFSTAGDGTDFEGYRIETRSVDLPEDFTILVQYARPLSEVSANKARIRVLLGVGVLGGALLALVAGLFVARNAMRPIAQLTATAREVGRTRDPELHVPVTGVADEVGELADTLNDMLDSLAASRAESEDMLARQRRFVADASHELRTPLTSVLANLELLVDVLQGDQGEAARSALRSTQRMRRLVADLLLLARADVRDADGSARAASEAPHAPTDLARVAIEVAGELEPVAGTHVLELDVRPVMVDGARDDLHRMALNLIENALRHTPPGTRVTVSVAPAANGRARFVVEDDGPGVPAELHGRIFERFVRGEGDRGGSFGLGLSIVRAVADAHAGIVVVEQAPHRGARFVVDLPRSTGSPATGLPVASPARPA